MDEKDVSKLDTFRKGGVPMPRLHIIQRLDSGFGILIPTKFLEQIGVQESDEVEIFCQEGTIVLHKVPSQRQTLNDPSPGKEQKIE